jgi:hypothetical protein
MEQCASLQAKIVNGRVQSRVAYQNNALQRKRGNRSDLINHTKHERSERD